MNLKVVCFGEVLWDEFHNEKKIGGAPLNVAIRIKSLKNSVSIISRIGNDSQGKNLISAIREKGINTSEVQLDDIYKTGNVKVKLDRKGIASYDIKFPRAWDFIELTEDVNKLVKNSDALIFGSLIARNYRSKDTLKMLLNFPVFKVFDVNLRLPYYTKELLIELMLKADFIKFNDDELLEISKYLGSRYNSIEQNIKLLSDKTNTSKICVTKGENGAVLLYDKKLYYNSGYSVKVADTVGAGDSFLGTLINYILKKENPQTALDSACAVGALVTQNEGANPVILESEIKKFIESFL